MYNFVQRSEFAPRIMRGQERGNIAVASVYEQVGGDETFRRLVDAFYRRVAQDPVLIPVFPPTAEAREPGKEGQRMFLIQYFGGPRTYSDQKGHPRLRMRHAHFPLGQRERDAWVANMLAAVDEVGIPEPARTVMRDYFENGATFMINVPS